MLFFFLERLKTEKKVESDRKKVLLDSLKQQMEADLKVFRIFLVLKLIMRTILRTNLLNMIYFSFETITLLYYFILQHFKLLENTN